MATRKGAAKGRRLTIEWGSVKRKSGGKTSNVKAYSKVIESVAKACGLKEAQIKAPTIKKDAKGRQRLSGTSITRSGSRYLLVSVGETTKTKKGTREVFHRVPLPPGISMAKASAILKKGNKAVNIKFPGAPAVVMKAKK